MSKNSVRRIFASAIKRFYRLQCREPYKSRKYLLLLGHMRSGSSVLSHVLASNPAIVGYGETHLTYSSEQSLSNLTYKVHGELRKLRITGEFDHDKILHNYILDGSILANPNVHVIYLVREPQAAIASMIRQFPDWFTGKDLTRTEIESSAIGYYCQRLKELKELSVITSNNGRCSALTYRNLTHSTELALAKLSLVHQLQTPLSSNYKTHRMTGVFGKGDPSKNIRKGYIDSSKQDVHFRIAEESLSTAREAYRACVEAFQSNCSTATDLICEA